MGAAVKNVKATSKKVATKSKKAKLSIVKADQQSFELTFAPQVTQLPVSEETTCAVIPMGKAPKKSNTLDFENQADELNILAKRLLDKFRLLKVSESSAAKYAKHSVASRYINDQTTEEIFPWAIEKSLEKWNQSKMVKEYDLLTAPMGNNVTELYSAKIKREARIREIQDYFWNNVHEASSIMVFKEFNEIWNYAYKIFNSKVSNTYRDTVKAKAHHEYIDYGSVEECLELNEFSEHFVRDDEKADVSRELLEILAEKIQEIDPKDSHNYLNVFKLHFCEERDLSYTCSQLNIERHKGARIKTKITELIEDLREEYNDRMAA